MARKERPLTDGQRNCLLAAEDTLYGDVKLCGLYARSVAGLRKRGLVEGNAPHVYLTDSGRKKLSEIIAGQ